MWCSIRLVEHQQEKRKELVQSILSYVRLAAFLTYRDVEGFVRYSIWFEDQYLSYVLGLHAAKPDLGGVEITPTDTPGILENCMIAQEMEMRGYGAAELPLDTGIRSATAALGTQITDTAYRLLICHRVERSDLIDGYVNSGGRPTSMYRKVAGMAAREAVGFFDSSPRPAAEKPTIKAKKPPYTHTRIILGANTEEHITILRDSFPAGSLKRLNRIPPVQVAAQACIIPKVRTSMIHFPVFNDAELESLEILPTNITEVPMEYGRAITSTTQPPTVFMDLINDIIHTSMPRRVPLYLDVSEEPDDASMQPEFPVQIIGGEPGFPISMMEDPHL